MAGSIAREKDDLAPDTRIGRYRIEDPVGRGGMGVVYRAFDEKTNRKVALKLLSVGIQPALRERFLAECEAEANIRHEHVMPVYDRGWLTEDRPYFVMELLYQPITLAELVEQIDMGTLGTNHPRLRAWTDRRRCLADVVLPVCEGVHVANAEYGIQHRDLKPDNVLIDIRTRRPYLIDFGICRDMNENKDAGRIVGTPRYLSPEQASARVDPRTDVWGLGSLVRYVITAEPPLEGTSPFTRMEVNERIEALKVAEERARAAGEEAKARGYAGRRAQLEDPGLRVQDDLIRDARLGNYLPLPEGTSPGLAAIINKAMAPASADRYETAGDLARDLRSWIKGGSVAALTEAGRRGAVFDLARRLLNRNVVRGAGALVALLLGIVLWTGLFGQPPPQADHRLADAAQDLEDLVAGATALQAQATSDRAALDPLGCALLQREISKRYERLVEMIDAAPADAAGPQLRSRLRNRASQVAARLAKATVAVRGRSRDTWRLLDLCSVDLMERLANGGTVPAPPGLYLLEGRPTDGLRIRLTIPGDPTARDVTLTIGARPSVVPPGLTWVPAGAVPLAEEEVYRQVGPLLASTDLVTNERYSEWLDELTPAERNASVPPTGFIRDVRDSSRWLVAPDMGSRPVLGVSPRDAQAYAAWRSEVEGLKFSLPREHEWMRMAAVDQLGTPGDHLLFPARGALPWQMRRRRGETVARPRYLPSGVGTSPYGVGQIYTPPGELVRSDEGDGFVAKGEAGMLPFRSALRRSTPVDLDEKGHPHGFRLIHVPE